MKKGETRACAQTGGEERCETARGSGRDRSYSEVLVESEQQRYIIRYCSMG